MAKTETGRFSELLRKALGMKGVQDVASELSPEISPTWQLEGPTAEWEFLKHVRVCGHGGRVASAPGFLPKMRGVNRIGSGILVVIEGISMTIESGSAILLIGLGTALFDHSLVTGTTTRDRRWGMTSPQRTSLLLSQDNSDAVEPVAEIIAETRRGAFDEWLFGFPIILIPGTAVDFWSPNLNLGLSWYLIWRERQIAPLEL